MFENTGKLIKLTAEVLFLISILADVICSLFVFNKMFTFWLGLIYSVSGLVGSFIACLLLYAIGELVENSTEKIKTLKEINEKMKK